MACPGAPGLYGGRIAIFLVGCTRQCNQLAANSVKVPEPWLEEERP